LQSLFVDSRLNYNVTCRISKLTTAFLVDVVLIDQGIQFKLVAFGAVTQMLALLKNVDVVLLLVPLSQLKFSTARFSRNFAGKLVRKVMI
jgi:hypothetical protein